MRNCVLRNLIGKEKSSSALVRGTQGTRTMCLRFMPIMISAPIKLRLSCRTIRGGAVAQTVSRMNISKKDDGLTDLELKLEGWQAIGRKGVEKLWGIMVSVGRVLDWDTVHGIVDD